MNFFNWINEEQYNEDYQKNSVKIIIIESNESYNYYLPSFVLKNFDSNNTVMSNNNEIILEKHERYIGFLE